MTIRMGDGDYIYEPVVGWGKLPDGWTYEDAAAIAVDRNDNVYIFNRGAHPMVVFDRHGNFLRSWGEDLFKKAHGAFVGPDDTIYCTDEGHHCVFKCTLEGKLLLTIGVPDNPAEYMSGLPFNRCTHTAISPQGDIFISDGYGNACVHKYSPNGKLIKSWGEPGIDPGKFNLVHNICCDPEGWVYVADRENHRVQVFNSDGKYETMWNNLHRPNGLFLGPGRQPICYVAESGPQQRVNFRVREGIGQRISIMTHDGKPLARVSRKPNGVGVTGAGPGEFISPHGIAVDGHGDIYIGETTKVNWTLYNPQDKEMPRDCRSVQKFRRVK